MTITLTILEVRPGAVSVTGHTDGQDKATPLELQHATMLLEGVKMSLPVIGRVLNVDIYERMSINS